jgi:hypothetical protein
MSVFVSVFRFRFADELLEIWLEAVLCRSHRLSHWFFSSQVRHCTLLTTTAGRRGRLHRASIPSKRHPPYQVQHAQHSRSGNASPYPIHFQTTSGLCLTS